MHLLFFCRGFFICTKTINFVDCHHNEHFHQVWFQLADGIILGEDDQNNMRSYTDNAEEGSKLMTICISHNPLGQDKLVVHATSKSLLRLICYKKKKKMKFYQRPTGYIRYL